MLKITELTGAPACGKTNALKMIHEGLLASGAHSTLFLGDATAAGVIYVARMNVRGDEPRTILIDGCSKAMLEELSRALMIMNIYLIVIPE